MGQLLKTINDLVKALITGIILGAITIGLVILALSLKQCITVKQTQQNVQSTTNKADSLKN